METFRISPFWVGLLGASILCDVVATAYLKWAGDLFSDSFLLANVASIALFAPAIVMVDMQLEHATKASLPSPRFPGEQGWYFNQGEKAGITDDWFTVAALVNSGH